MKYITVDDKNDTTHMINTQYIQEIVELDNYIKIVMVDGTEIIVMGTLEDIKNKMNNEYYEWA